MGACQSSRIRSNGLDALYSRPTSRSVSRTLGERTKDSCGNCKGIEAVRLLDTEAGALAMDETHTFQAGIGCIRYRAQKFATSMQNLHCMRSLQCNDTHLRLKTLLQVGLYYVDILLDCRQLLLFHKKRQFSYLTLNLVGIIGGCILDGYYGNMPLVGPGQVLLQQWRLHEQLPVEPSIDDLEASAGRREKLEALLQKMEHTGLAEAIVEGSLSLLTQGFALMFEKQVKQHSDNSIHGYTFDEQSSLAISLAFSIIVMSWAFCNLDTAGRILRSFDVETQDGSRPFPVVMGSLSFSKRLCLLPVRCLEIIARAGTILTAAVGFELQVEEHAMFFIGVMLCTMACFDAIACLWKGEAGACSRLPLNFLARASPLAFPMHLPVLGPPALLFYGLRSLQNICLGVLTISIFGWSWEQLTHAFSCRAAWLVAMSAAVSSVMNCLALVGLVYLAPLKLPLGTRRAWGLLLGRGPGNEGTAIPKIPAEERRIMQVYGFCTITRLAIPHVVTDQKDMFAAELHKATDAEASAWCVQLKHKRQLKVLNMRDNRDITVDGWKNIVTEVLSSSNDLEELNVSCCRLNDGKVHALGLGLRHKPRLKKLSMSSSRHITEDGWGFLSTEVLADKSELEELDISGCDLNDAKLHVLLSGLRDKIKLKRLIMSSNRDVTANGWKAISKEALANKEQLEELDIGSCSLDDAKVQALALGLNKKPRLKKLIIGDHRFSSVTWADIAAESLIHLQDLSVLLLDSFRKEAALTICHSEALMINSLSLSALTDAACHMVIPWLRHCLCLKRLSLRDNYNLTEYGWKGIVTEALVDKHQLEELDIGSCALNDMKLQLLDSLLKSKLQLKLLSMRSNKDISVHAWKDISIGAFKDMHQLEALDISRCDLDDAKVQVLVPGLTNKLRLRNLSMSGNSNITVRGWKAISTELLVNKDQLEALDVRHCSLDDAKVQVLAHGLVQKCRLKKLDMSFNSNVTIDGWSAMSTDALAGKHQLEELTINFAGLNDAKVQAMVPGILNKSRLKKLSMSYNRDVSTDGWNVIASAFLADKPELEELDISECGLNDAKVRALASGLRNQLQLRKLRVASSRHVTADGWNCMVSNALADTVEELDISDCDLDDAKVQVLALGLKDSIRLKKLNISENHNVSGDGWKAITMNFLVSRTQLEELDISDCGLNDAKVQILALGLINKPQLTTVMVRDNGDVTAQGWRAIRTIVGSNCLCPE